MEKQRSINEDSFEIGKDENSRKLYLIPCDTCGSIFERFVSTYRICKNKTTCRHCISKKIGRTLRRRVLDARK